VVEHHYCPSCGFPVGTLGTNNEDKFIGKTLPGGYHILDLISVGGMGRVYRAEQSVLGRTVAVKIIHPHLLSDENSAVRFMTEARAASQLNHPNSVAVFDFGRTDDGQPYLVMEFLRGKDLARVAYEEGPLSFARIVDVLRQVLTALAEAHDLGIIHRDLKPENVILEPLRRGGDFVKVVDFGLAKLKADAQAPSVTSPGIVCGTPDYMAPEQGRGDPIDGRSDLYAVGVMLFQLLTGQLPFEADNPTQVVMMHMTLPVPDPRQVAPERDIPEQLIDVVNKALQKNPERRFQDALEFADGLKEALILAESLPPDQRTPALPLGGGGPARITCPTCAELVPVGKFCGECGARLPVKSTSPDTHTPPQLPLPFAGRDDDLAWLEERLSSASHDILGARIVGDSGAGKTRLLAEFAARARAAGAFVVVTGPDPHWAEVAYYTVRAAIRNLAQLSDEDIRVGNYPDAHAEARRGLREIYAGAPGRNDRRAPAERRHAVAESLRWALTRAASLSARGPVILAVDDLQRVDGASRNAFSDVLGEPPRARALLIATHTPGFEAGWGADRSAARVLGGLSLQLALRLLKSTSSPEQLKAMEQEAGGRGILPMYIEQVLRYTLDGGSDAPARLADLIALRVDTIEPNARRALQALVVLGDSAETKAILRLLPKDTDIDPALELLLASGLIERDGDLVSVVHPLLRDVVLAGIPVAVRRELHAKALRLSEKLGTPLEASALHAYFAQDSFQALLLLEQVAQRAQARDDQESETLALRRGLEIARQEISRGELDDPLRAVLIFGRKLGAALTRTGNYADAEGVLREALDIAGPNGPDRAQVLGALAQVAYGRRRSKEAVGYMDQAIETARRSGAHDLEITLRDTRRAWVS
jgi:serine/threonine-protein kinase